MPTLRDVAKLACCDVSTVSRALNNNPCVHAETKKRIMAAVEKLSYRPNLLPKDSAKVSVIRSELSYLTCIYQYFP